MLEDRSILFMTCTQSMVLLTHTENTDIFTIVFLKPSGTGKMGDHLANISVVAETCQSKNPHFEGIIFYYFLFLSVITFHFLFNFYFNLKEK